MRCEIVAKVFYISNRLLQTAKILPAFSFGVVGAKEKAIKKKSAVRRNFAVCGRRGGLRALHLRRLLKKAGENF